MYECHCDDRLRTEPEGSIPLTYTVLRPGLEHLQIEPRHSNKLQRDNLLTYSDLFMVSPTYQLI